MPLLRLDEHTVVNSEHIISLRRAGLTTFRPTVAEVTLTVGPSAQNRTWSFAEDSEQNPGAAIHDSLAKLAVLLVTLADAGVTLVGLDENTHVAPAAISSMLLTQYPPAVHVHFGGDSVSWVFDDRGAGANPYRAAVQRLGELEALVEAALSP